MANGAPGAPLPWFQTNSWDGQEPCMPHTEAPAAAPLSEPGLQASGGRIVLPAAEQPIHRLGICVVELRGLGPHIVDRGERTNDRGT